MRLVLSYINTESTILSPLYHWIYSINSCIYIVPCSQSVLLCDYKAVTIFTMQPWQRFFPAIYGIEPPLCAAVYSHMELSENTQ